MLLLLLLCGTLSPVAATLRAPAVPPLIFSAGFTDNAVLQRGNKGTAVYGFASSAAALTVTVSGDASYTVDALVSAWVDDSGCNRTDCPDHPRTSPMSPHGAFVWRAQLWPQSKAGGDYSISVAAAKTGAKDPNGTAITISSLTYGDVFFCSGQSNMDLEIYFTFSVDELKAQMQGTECVLASPPRFPPMHLMLFVLCSH